MLETTPFQLFAERKIRNFKQFVKLDITQSLNASFMSVLGKYKLELNP